MSASRRLGVFALMMVITQPAWAHHPMDGKLPQTFLQGLLSGFGHPVIGIDHLAAIVGVGILAALAGRSAAVVLAFSVAVIAGVGLHLSKVNLPAGELLVGLTTLLIGALVIARQSMGAGLAALLFAIAGLVHGYALGESIVGAEASPLVAYLLGLLIMQTAIGVVVYAAVRSLARWPARTTGVTVAGVLVALAGGIATAAAAGLA
ncbi:MAG TPA: HupE/UreJ family protein [Reyranella sp.]|nr:HupE/UreJ family protein [Reyranella sp.]